MCDSAWGRFVKASQYDFTEAELTMLPIDGIRSLLAHYNINNAIEVARVEVQWAELQKEKNRNSTSTGRREEDEDDVPVVIMNSPDHGIIAPPRAVDGLVRSPSPRQPSPARVSGGSARRPMLDLVTPNRRHVVKPVVSSPSTATATTTEAERRSKLKRPPHLLGGRSTSNPRKTATPRESKPVFEVPVSPPKQHRVRGRVVTETARAANPNTGHDAQRRALTPTGVKTGYRRIEEKHAPSSIKVVDSHARPVHADPNLPTTKGDVRRVAVDRIGIGRDTNGFGKTRAESPRVRGRFMAPEPKSVAENTAACGISTYEKRAEPAATSNPNDAVVGRKVEEDRAVGRVSLPRQDHHASQPGDSAPLRTASMGRRRYTPKDHGIF
eukprot:PhM_4_TR11549/c0_g1_i1/m.88922